MKLKYFSFLLILFTLESCSIPTEIYIQNLTSKSITLKVRFKKPFKEFYIGDGVKFSNVSEITTVKNLSNKKNATKLNFVEIDDKTFVIHLPPNSTTVIERTHNFNFNLEKIEFNGDERKIEDLLINSTKKRDHYIYQIKN